MPLTERLAIVLETVGAGAAARDFDKVGAASQGLAGKLRAVGVEGAGMAGLVKGSLVAAGTAIVAFAGKSVDVFFEAAQAVLAFQRASGATAEEASALVAAFDDVGISAEVGAKAMFQLGKRLVEDSEELRGYGVNAARGADGNVDLAETLKDVADAYVAMADPAQRAALINTAFGRSGQEMIPILERGRAGIEAMYEGAAATGQIFTQDEIDKAEDFRLAMDELNDTLAELQIEAGKALLPILSDLADAVSRTIEWGEKLKVLPFAKWLFGIGEFEDANEDAADSAAAVERRIREAGIAARESARDLTEVGDNTLAASRAQRAYDAATRAVADADRSLADARAEYNKLLKQGAVDEEKVAGARRSLTEATRSLGSADRGLARAQEDYNDAQNAFLAVPSDTNADRLRDAKDGLADAEDSVASATDRQTDAQQQLARAQRGDPEFNDKLARAKGRLGDAEQGVADAQYRSSEAAYQLDGALAKQTATLSDNAGAVAQVREEWNALLRLKPEVAAFLAGPAATLAADAPPSLPGGLLNNPGPLAAGNLSPVINNNQQINVTTTVPVDPLTLARQIIWNING